MSILKWALAVSLTLAVAPLALGQTPLTNAFTYQGRLVNNGVAASGTFDLRFVLYTDLAAGAVTGCQCFDNVAITDGLFTVTLNGANEFGTNPFIGDERFLEVRVRADAIAGNCPTGPCGNLGTFTALTPRQKLTAAPYSIYSLKSSWAGLTGVPTDFADGVDNVGGTGDGHSLDAADGSPVDALAVDNNGNVGIGTTTPVAPLSLGAYQGGTATSAILGFTKQCVLSGPYNTAANAGTSVKLLISDYSNDAGDDIYPIYAEDENNGVDFFVRKQAGNVSTAYVGGKLGIGVTSPAAKLHIGGTAGVDGIQFPDGSVQTTASGGSFWSSSGSTIHNTNSGNVGIGTSSPGYKLEVRGSGYFEKNEGDSGTVLTSSRYSATNQSAMQTRIDGNNLYGLEYPVGDAPLLLNGSHSGDVILATGGGKVGINVLNPATNLHVSGADNDGTTGTIKVTSGSESMLVDGNEIDSTSRLFFNHNNSSDVICDGGGFVGIGTDTPTAKLHINGADNNGITGPVRVSSGGESMLIDGNEIDAFNSPLYLNHNSGGDVIIAEGGTTRVRVLEITGADLAEKFPVSDEVKPGMVVMIDRNNSGKLCLARSANNRAVAGVVSGANDFTAGAILGNLPGNEKSPPIALSGRVYVWCDAEHDAIEPTDLLTTSDTPGHAMKVVDHAKAQGAILGKAMTGLPKGEKGLVLVLVGLQ